MKTVYKIELLKFDGKGKYNKLTSLNDTNMQDWKKKVEEIALSEYYDLKVKIKKGK